MVDGRGGVDPRPVPLSPAGGGQPRYHHLDTLMVTESLITYLLFYDLNNYEIALYKLQKSSEKTVIIRWNRKLSG